MAGCNLSKKMQNTSRKVNRLYERFFYWWGCTVASHPYKVHGCQMDIARFLDHMCLALWLLDYGSATLRCKI